MSEDTENLIGGIIMLWTIVGFIGTVFGLHIGWWDLLGIPLPVNPRYSY